MFLWQSVALNLSGVVYVNKIPRKLRICLLITELWEGIDDLSWKSEGRLKKKGTSNLHNYKMPVIVLYKQNLNVLWYQMNVLLSQLSFIYNVKKKLYEIKKKKKVMLFFETLSWLVDWGYMYQLKLHRSHRTFGLKKLRC